MDEEYYIRRDAQATILEDVLSFLTKLSHKGSINMRMYNADEETVFSLTEFKEHVKMNILTPEDGDGYWATNVHVSSINVWNGEGRPSWATQVVWYNK
jgi:hypothetical protein